MAAAVAVWRSWSPRRRGARSSPQFEVASVSATGRPAPRDQPLWPRRAEAVFIVTGATLLAVWGRVFRGLHLADIADRYRARHRVGCCGQCLAYAPL